MPTERTLKFALTIILTSLAVIISPFLWFPAFGTKAYPGQHLINVVAGILLGPWYASLIALMTGIIRMSLGVGTIYSLPGGIPGAFLVGITRNILLRKDERRIIYATFMEPVGTVLIGGTISFFLIAPFIGTEEVLTMLQRDPWTGLLWFWGLWSLSSIPGTILGFTVISFLQKSRVLEKIIKR